MRPRIRPACAVGGLVLLAAALAGCEGGSSPDAPAASTSDQVVVPDSRVTADLTPAQARSALLKPGDLPSGWAQDDSSDDPSSARATYLPRACSVLGTTAKDRTTLARASYSLTGQFAANLTQEIYTPRGSTATERLADLRSRLTTCSRYQVRTASGTATIKVSSLTFPALGDGTLAFRAEVNGGLIAAADDVVFIAAGPQVVRFDSISTGTGLPAAELEKLVRLAYLRLTQAS